MRHTRIPSAILATALLLTAHAGARAAKPDWQWLWVYVSTNLQVNERADDLVALMERAKKAGYNGVLLADYKFGNLADRPDHYYRNLERVRQAAERLGIEIIPAVMPVGYSGSILQHDPNLAAGLPVRDCPMVVRDGAAAVEDPSNLLPNGGFEETGGKRMPGWDWMDPCAARDTAVAHSGEASLRMTRFREGNDHGNGRVVRKLTLAPFRQYRVDCWIRTKDLSGPGNVRIMPLADGQALNYTHLGVKPTQEWTRHSILFNSLRHEEVRLYIGIWGGREGTLWLDDVSLREVAGVNLLRRDGCPLRVTSDDGRTVYEEGRDFRRWAWPKMGRVPWPGSFEVAHPEPPLVLTEDSRIKDGQRLRVSFFHTVVIHSGQVGCCLAHPKMFEVLEEQVRLVKKYLRPKKYMMSHDEIRVAGWCDLCRAAGANAGEALAKNVARCTDIIRRTDPEAQVFVWSDMFDPHHNARDEYYLVADTLEGSWKGLDPSVHVVCWYLGKAGESMPFFAKRGHKLLMAGYYDQADVKANVFGWREAAAKVPQAARGLMYTTWRHNYADLETFARLAAQTME
jgi:hypothetical protein